MAIVNAHTTMQISISLPADPALRGELLAELTALAHNMVIRDGVEIDLELDGQVDHVLEKWRQLNVVVATASAHEDTAAPHGNVAAPQLGLASD